MHSEFSLFECWKYFVNAPEDGNSDQMVILFLPLFTPFLPGIPLFIPLWIGSDGRDKRSVLFMALWLRCAPICLPVGVPASPAKCPLSRSVPTRVEEAQAHGEQRRSRRARRSRKGGCLPHRAFHRRAQERSATAANWLPRKKSVFWERNLRKKSEKEIWERILRKNSEKEFWERILRKRILRKKEWQWSCRCFN